MRSLFISYFNFHDTEESTSRGRPNIIEAGRSIKDFIFVLYLVYKLLQAAGISDDNTQG